MVVLPWGCLRTHNHGSWTKSSAFQTNTRRAAVPEFFLLQSGAGSNMAYLNTYANRAKKHTNPAAKDLLETVERKQSNLCVSVDVTSSKDFLSIIDAVGPYVSLIKASLCGPTLTLSIRTNNTEARHTSISLRTLSLLLFFAYKSSAPSTIF